MPASGYAATMPSAQHRSAGRDRDWTDAESEGQPPTEDQPPGIDADTAEEGTPLPADHPVGSDERGVTALGASLPDTVAERAARERPDFPQVPDDNPGGRLATGASDAGDPPEGEWAEDDGGLSAEEAAMHVEGG